MEHHEQTLSAFTTARAAEPATLGVVLVGSVARGDERPDSDVDVYLVVTDDAYAAAQDRGEVAYVTTDGVSYDHGYVDVKLASPGYLSAAVERADDPTRASFLRARVVLDRMGDLETAVTAMGRLPEAEWPRRIASYRAQLALYGGYFLVQAAERGDRFLLRHSAVHATYAAGRCALAAHRRLFRGQKYLAADLTSLAELPDGWLDAWWALLDEPAPRTAERLTALTDDWFGGPLTVDESLSTFIADNELGWLHGGRPPEFW